MRRFQRDFQKGKTRMSLRKLANVFTVPLVKVQRFLFRGVPPGHAWNVTNHPSFEQRSISPDFHTTKPATGVADNIDNRRFRIVFVNSFQSLNRRVVAIGGNIREFPTGQIHGKPRVGENFGRSTLFKGSPIVGNVPPNAFSRLFIVGFVDFDPLMRRWVPTTNKVLENTGRAAFGQTRHENGELDLERNWLISGAAFFLRIETNGGLLFWYYGF